MSQLLKQLLVAAMATAALLAMAVPAAAEVEEIAVVEPSGDSEMASLGNLTFRGSGFIEIELECEVSLTGDVAEGFTNTAGAYVASLESGRAECEEATARLLVDPELPWSLLLREETELEGDSTLAPLTLELAEIEFVVGGVTCLYQGDISLSLPASGDPLRAGLATVTAGRVTKVTGSIFCPASGTLTGALAIAPAPAMQRAMRRLTPDLTTYDFGTSGGTRTITFTNRSNVDQRVWQTHLDQGNNWFRIVDSTCRGTDLAAKVLKDVDVQPEESRCIVRVQYNRPTPPPGQVIIHPYRDWVRIEGDPAVITTHAIMIVIGR